MVVIRNGRRAKVRRVSVPSGMVRVRTVQVWQVRSGTKGNRKLWCGTEWMGRIGSDSPRMA